MKSTGSVTGDKQISTEVI